MQGLHLPVLAALVQLVWRLQPNPLLACWPGALPARLRLSARLMSPAARLLSLSRRQALDLLQQQPDILLSVSDNRPLSLW